MTDLEQQLPVFARLPAGSVCATVVGRPHLPADMRAFLAETWARLSDGRPDLYDGQVCRVRRIRVADVGIALDMERSSFAHYLATREPRPQPHFAREHRCDPLGLTAMVLTNDGRIVTTTRSSTAEQNPNGLYFVGGFCEPPVHDGPLDIFAEVRREVREEIGLCVDGADVSLVGIGYDPDLSHPEAFFLVRYDGSFAQVRGHWPVARDAGEADNLQALRLHDLVGSTGAAFERSTWSFAFGIDCLRRMFAPNGERVSPT